jgi:hypothetical protein
MKCGAPQSHHGSSALRRIAQMLRLHWGDNLWAQALP